MEAYVVVGDPPARIEINVLTALDLSSTMCPSSTPTTPALS